MPKLIILGSSNAIASHDSENTHMVLVGAERIVLVDCVNNPIRRLEQANVDFMDLTDLILTYFHPDHVSGVPLLLMDMWLRGRKKPINIYGLHHTLDRMEQLMGLYAWEEWPHFFPVAFHRIPANENNTLLDCDEFKVLSSPVRHLIPTLGLRFEFKDNKKVMAYSCDTEPCVEVISLASGADIFDSRGFRRLAGTFICRASRASRCSGRGGKIVFDPLSDWKFYKWRSHSRGPAALSGRGRVGKAIS